MKHPFPTLLAWLSALTLLSCPTAVSAQMPGGLTDFNPALLQLFGEHKSFSSRVQLRMTDPSGKELVKTPMGLSLLDGNVRVEVDINQITSSNLDAEGLALFKKAGMDRVISILRPDQGKSVIIFPTAKAMATEPMSASDTASFAEKYQIKATESGKETLGAHACVRKQVSVTNSKGVRMEGTVWYATSLRGFPVKISLPDGGSIVEMTFSDVKLQKPDVSQFQAPPGTAQYASVEKLLQERVFQALSK